MKNFSDASLGLATLINTSLIKPKQTQKPKLTYSDLLSTSSIVRRTNKIWSYFDECKDINACSYCKLLMGELVFYNKHINDISKKDYFAAYVKRYQELRKQMYLKMVPFQQKRIVERDCKENDVPIDGTVYDNINRLVAVFQPDWESELLKIIRHYAHIIQHHSDQLFKPSLNNPLCTYWTKSYDASIRVFEPCLNNPCNATKRMYLAKKLYPTWAQRNQKDQNKKKKKLKKLQDLRNMIKTNKYSNNQLILLEYLDLSHRYFCHRNLDLDADDSDNKNKFGTINDLNINDINDNNNNDNDDEKKRITSYQYSFGEKFLFWDAFKNEPNYVKPSYASLKEEILAFKSSNNDKSLSSAMEIDQWDITYTKSVILTNDSYSLCQKKLPIKAQQHNKKEQEMYNVLSNGITTQHVLALVIYCNYGDIQSEFKRIGTRKGRNDVSYKDMIPRVQKVGNFFKLIDEAIRFWGTRVRSDLIYYHGINGLLPFDEFAPKFNAVFSTTTDLNVSEGFASDKGIILGLTDSSKHGRRRYGHRSGDFNDQIKNINYTFDKCFDVEWLSGYPEQKENLFSFASELSIIDVRIAPNIMNTNNTLNLSALTLYDNIFGENSFTHFIVNMNETIRIETQKRLIKFIELYESPNESSNIISPFIYSCFDAIINKKKKSSVLYVIKSEFKKLDNNLVNILNKFINDQNMKQKIVDTHEYEWKITGDNLTKMHATTGSDLFIRDANKKIRPIAIAGWENDYLLPNNGGTVRFYPYFLNSCGDKKLKFHLKINNLPPNVSNGVNLYFSITFPDINICYGNIKNEKPMKLNDVYATRMIDKFSDLRFPLINEKKLDYLNIGIAVRFDVK